MVSKQVSQAIISEMSSILSEFPTFMMLCFSKLSKNNSFHFVTVVHNDTDACGIMVIVGGNRHGDTSSTPGRDW